MSAGGPEIVGMWVGIPDPADWYGEVIARVAAVLRDPGTTLEPLPGYR
ncbi:hypothetical protein [Corynebacterium marinum]|nr:hypothetical protein [Corynebacterium marinum]